MPAGPGRARVRFDTGALADDLARLSPPGQTALRHAHDRFKREGGHSIGCAPARTKHRAGTSLPGCLKVYLPDWDGDWRMIFQIATDEAGPLLSYLACGVGHQPRGTHKLPTPTKSPTIAFTADGAGEGCLDGTDAAPNDPRDGAQRPDRRPETRRRFDTRDRPPERRFQSEQEPPSTRRDYATLSQAGVRSTAAGRPASRRKRY